jgi:uncharacterized protein (DUF2141 family)
MRTSNRFLIGCAAMCGLALQLPSVSHADDTKGTLKVSAVDFKSAKGQAVISVWRHGASWLDVANAFRSVKVEIKDGKASATFRDMPYDEYAVGVIHDENSNGKLDMSWLPYPSPEEGAGVSNNWVRKGKPEYSKAKFQFARPLMSVRVLIVY